MRLPADTVIGALAGGAVPPAVDKVPVVLVTVPGVADVIETTMVHPPGASDVPLAIVIDVGVTVTPVHVPALPLVVVTPGGIVSTNGAINANACALLLPSTSVSVAVPPDAIVAGAMVLVSEMPAFAIVVVGAVLVAGGPAGGVAVAVFTIVPLPPAVPVMVSVMEPPTGNVAMLRPAPCSNATVNVVGHVAPPEELGHVTPDAVKFATAGSVTSVPSAALGPGFVTTTV